MLVAAIYIGYHKDVILMSILYFLSFFKVSMKDIDFKCFLLVVCSYPI